MNMNESFKMVNKVFNFQRSITFPFTENDLKDDINRIKQSVPSGDPVTCYYALYCYDFPRDSRYDFHDYLIGLPNARRVTCQEEIVGDDDYVIEAVTVVFVFDKLSIIVNAVFIA